MDRRDFLNSTLLASGAALLSGVTPLSLLAEPDWTGFSGVGDYAVSNGNTYHVMSAGHAIRDHTFDHVGIFTYSHEEGTSAYALEDGISGPTKTARRARVRSASPIGTSCTALPCLAMTPSSV